MAARTGAVALGHGDRKRRLITSGGYADLAARATAPPLMSFETPDHLGLRLDTVAGAWEPIGLGAIQDLVQEAYGPVDLDRAMVALDPAGLPHRDCPACRGERFGFPGDLIDAMRRMCEAHADAADRFERAAPGTREGQQPGGLAGHRQGLVPVEWW